MFNLNLRKLPSQYVEVSVMQITVMQKSMSEWSAPISTPRKRCAAYFVDLFCSFDS